MESESDEEVSIMNSNEKLKKLLEENGLTTEEAFKTYINSLQYDTIKDFPLGTSWFNTSEPLSFKKHLKGKLVLLDFFTYCCINCMHILPDLKDIEETFSVSDGLAVIGVHSAKFENETKDENVKNAVLRYNIDHAVVNDEGAKMWIQCGINCWPSLLLISPEGQPLVLLMGEGHRDTLKLYIKHFLAFYKAKNKMSDKSLPIIKTVDSIQHNEHLLFPGKLKAFENRLCISDSGNNRIIIIDDYQLPEKKIFIVGSSCGEVGFQDGGFHDAMFNQPQGVCFLNKDVIFVADNENHAVRKVDLVDSIVSTVAGHGKQSFDQDGGLVGIAQGISSPWDLEMFTTDEGKKVLLIAMAGTHQIWGVFLVDTKWWKGKEYKKGSVVCIAGSGMEENRNNNYPNKAAFAQPSGLALNVKDKVVFIADSESSTVRKLDLRDGKVSAVVGGAIDPNNLFAFGDKDGINHEAKLQHSLGVAMGSTPQNSHKVFVADTYNHKIKVIDSKTNHIKTITTPTTRKFNEPSGLCQTPDGQLYVADTNNHQIKICTLNKDETEIVKVDILKLENIGLEPIPDTIDTSEKILSLPVVYLPKTSDNIKVKGVKVYFKVKLSANLHFTEGAPQKWSGKAKEGAVLLNIESGKEIESFCIELSCLGKDANVKKDVKDEKVKKVINDVVDVHFQVNTCEGDLCFNKRFIVRIPVIIGDDEINKMADVYANVVVGRDRVNLS